MLEALSRKLPFKLRKSEEGYEFGGIQLLRHVCNLRLPICMTACYVAASKHEQFWTQHKPLRLYMRLHGFTNDWERQRQLWAADDGLPADLSTSYVLFQSILQCREGSGVLETLHILDMHQGLTAECSTATPRRQPRQPAERMPTIVERIPQKAPSRQPPGEPGTCLLLPTRPEQV